ncbi:MAG: type II secretion system protein GspD [Cellulophaga sp.]
MKKIITILILITCFKTLSQNKNRISNIKNNLELLAVDNKGLTENLKLNINVNTVSLSDFLIAVSEIHNLNITVDPNLKSISIVNNFSNVSISDLLLFLCKQYDLDIRFTGNILSINKYTPPQPEIKQKPLNVNFDAVNNRISLDLKENALARVFKEIINKSGQNLLYNSGMENLPLSIYLINAPIDIAINKLAETNNLIVTKSRDGFYLFSRKESSPNNNRIYSRNDFQYQIIDTTKRLLNVSFENSQIATIIKELSLDLNLDIYTATPLEKAGTISFKAKNIHFDKLLEKMFENSAQGQESKSNTSTPNVTHKNNSSISSNFTFKKENNIYFFGTSDQLSVRKVEIVTMMHRSVELLGDPSQSAGGGRSTGRTIGGNINYLGNNGYQNSGYQNNSGYNNTLGNTSQRFNNARNNTIERSNSFASNTTEVQAIINIIPDDVIANLDIRTDYELNSFLVSGPAAKINRFRNFIKKIDKPVPVVLIEVMIIEVKKTSSVETGISWGIGNTPKTTQGNIFPATDVTLGAKTINKVIGGFDGFGSFNVGKVVPNFFATIKALESNGNIKIRSTPKLSTLNGHRAKLSIGETTYYVVTNQNFFGSQIPTTSEVRNYQPIDAELAISIKPLVSGDGQVTLDINVIQSDFSGERIEDDAPPGLTSREFSSIIRMQNQDLAILGGLEEKIKNDSGSGVPLLARIPIIKWLFSKRKREDTKQKLTILIKPTVIY